MAKSYHFLQGTNVVGPLQYDRLAKLVQDGVVAERTMLSDDASNWKAAVELVPQLFSNGVARSTAHSSSSSGAERWYVQANDKEYGPISYTELLGWVNSKSVVAETLIRKSESGAWQRADTVFAHLGGRGMAARTAKPQPEPSPYSSLAIRTQKPEPGASEPSPRASADEGSGAAMTVFGILLAVAGVFLVVQGFIQLKAAFGFAGIIAVVMLVRFLASLGKTMGNSK